MPHLKPAEEAFLEARQEEEASLRAKIDEVEDRLAPIREEYDAIQSEIAPQLDAQRELGRKTRDIIESSGLIQLKNDLSDVVKDVTKLLKKRRNA